MTPDSRSEMPRDRHRQIRALLETEDREGLLHLFATLAPEADLTPGELVTKGRAILLGPDENPFSLEDAEAAFSQALAIEPTYLPALLELAWYYHAVQDDSQRALPLFERALELGRRSLTEAAQGYAGCLFEMKSKEVAASFLRSLHGGALLVENLGEEERAWLQPEDDGRELSSLPPES